MILALDTSGRELLVCTLTDDCELVEGRAEPGIRHQARVIEIVDTLAGGPDGARGLTMVAVARGPGSQTGLRVGLATAAGIAFARRLPIVPVSSLSVAAHRSSAAGDVLAAVSAGRRNFYVQAFAVADGNGISRDQPRLVSLDEVAEGDLGGLPVAAESAVGEAWQARGLPLAAPLRPGPEALARAVAQAVGEGAEVAYHELTGDYGES